MQNKQRGFTLLEIFIALAIGLILLSGILSVFVGMRTTSSETISYGELQENGRYAMSLVTNDLLRQNFWGDLKGNLDFAGVTQTPVAAALVGDCVGDGANNASFPVAIGAFRTLWGKQVDSANMMGCISDAKIGSDLLQLKRAIASPFGLAPPLTIASLPDDRYYIHSNTNSAAIFAGDDAAIPTVNIGRLWEYQHHIYYVRNDTQGSNTVPVLMQGRLQNDQPNNAIVFDIMVEGIEQLRFLYGVDTDDDGVVDVYLSAADVEQDHWDNADNIRIIAVKIYILAREISPDNKYTNNNVYQLGDVSFDANGDNYRRLLFSSTVALSNARMDSW